MRIQPKLASLIRLINPASPVKILVARLALVACLVVPSYSVMAQETSPPPVYQVEILVFETGALRGWTEEVWPYLEYPVDIADTIEMLSLSPDKLLLTEQAKKMKPSAGYRILLHEAWILDANKENKGIRLKIENFPKTSRGSKLTGSLFFYKSRYTHIDLTLQIDKNIPKRIRTKFAEHQRMDMEWFPDEWSFRINTSKKIKSGELHYIDHPIFGALLKIKRIRTD